MYNISVFRSVCVGWEVPRWGAPGFLYCLLRPEYGYKREVLGSQAFQLLLVRFPSSGTAYLPGFLVSPDYVRNSFSVYVSYLP